MVLFMDVLQWKYLNCVVLRQKGILSVLEACFFLLPINCSLIPYPLCAMKI